MNKSELIDHISDQSGLSKAGANRAINVILGAITNNLKKGNTVSISGFGTFAVRKRSSRLGRNPRSGEPLQITSAKVPIFKSSSALKENLN